jgi:conjugative relaxase-like TrwC/TraI family protein
MLTFRAGAPGGVEQAKAYTAHLLERTLPEDQMALADYYGRRSSVDEALAEGMGSIPRTLEGMTPEVAAAFGVDTSRPLSREEFGNILGGRRADGSALPGHQREIRAYKSKDGEAPERDRTAWMDLCLSAPKKVSLAWFAAGTEGERQGILQAHRTAVLETIRHIEKEVAFATFGHGRDESKGVEPGRMGFITVDHFTSRPTVRVARPDPTTGQVTTELYTAPLVAGDVQLHTHVITPNLILTESGRAMSIDTTRIAGRVKEFGAIYQGILDRGLREMGVQTRIDPKTHTVDLPCIPDHVAVAFSKRSMNGAAAAAEYAKRQGHDWTAMPAEQRAAMLKAAIKEGRKGKGDDLANLASWRKQAADLGWKHTTAVGMGPHAPVQTGPERVMEGADAARPYLSAALEKDAVLTGSDVRLAAARGLLAAGAMQTPEDVRAVAVKLARDGVDQDGQRTQLLFPMGGDRQRPERTLVTTGLHKAQEERVMELAREATGPAAGGGLPRALLDKMLEPARLQKILGSSKPIQFSDEQRAAYLKAGGDGLLGVTIGGAGAGKTTLIAPLVSAWKEDGREVWGTAQAWRQAQALRDAGVEGSRVWALDPFIKKAQANPEMLHARSVVVLDEFSLIGTKQLLQLQELQKERGFKLQLVGDQRQCQAISAGNLMDLLERALGSENIPAVIRSVRQQSEQERELVRMFRHGEVEGALGLMRDQGRARLVHGDHGDVVRHVAERWDTIRQEHKDDPNFRLGVAAPTNADALAISRAIRDIKQSRGEVGANVASLDATDGKGNAFALDLAPGDRVRLFERTRGLFTNSRGQDLSLFVGNNGSVLTVLEVRPSAEPDKGGIVVRTAEGKSAFVPWGEITDRPTGRIKLTYGDALTINSAQGVTDDKYLVTMPSGSAQMNLFMAHVGNSRHRISSEFIGSFGAEAEQVQLRRPVNAPALSAPEMEAAVWANVTRNLKREPVKATAMNLVTQAQNGFRKAREAFQGGMRRRETRAQLGMPETTLRRQVQESRVEHGLAPVVAQIEMALQGQGAVIDKLGGKPPALPPPLPTPRVDPKLGMAEIRMNALAPIVAEGRMALDDAVRAVMEAHRSELVAKGQVVWNPVHQMAVTRERRPMPAEGWEKLLLGKIDTYDRGGKAALWSEPARPELWVAPRAKEAPAAAPGRAQVHKQKAAPSAAPPRSNQHKRTGPRRGR